MFLSVRHGSERRLEFRDVESRREARALGLRWQDGIAFIDTLVPPRPGALLHAAPRKHRDGIWVIVYCPDRVTFVREFARRPGTMRLKVFDDVLLSELIYDCLCQQFFRVIMIFVRVLIHCFENG